MGENLEAVQGQPEEPLDERLAAAVWHGTSLDEDDAWEAVRVLLPLISAHARAEYDRGYEYGDLTACRRVADRIGLRLTPPARGGFPVVPDA